jgi:hypothetical protein
LTIVPVLEMVKFFTRRMIGGKSFV